MSVQGLLIDTEWCTGCHSCEIACQIEHSYPVGQTGILLNEMGPWEFGDNEWQLSYLPGLTAQCDGCEDRVATGKAPTCVHHCQAKCIEYGTIEDLSKQIDENSKKVLFAL